MGDTTNALSDHLKALSDMKPGEWYYFNPCVFDSGGGLINIVSVEHKDEALAFTFRAVDTPPESPPTQHCVHRMDVGENGEVFGMYLRPVYEMELVGYLTAVIRNVGPKVLEEAKRFLQ